MIRVFLILSIFSFLNLKAFDFGIADLNYSAKKMNSFIDKDVVSFEDIILKSGKITLKAKKLTVNYKTKDFIAEGNVELKNNDFVSRSQKASGNLEKKIYVLHHPKTKYLDWGLRAETASIYQHKYITHKVSMSSCTEAIGNQHYHIVADKIIYTKEKGFLVYNSTIYLAGIPVFYLPYFPGKIGVDDGSFRVRPAYSSRWGTSLLVSRKYGVNENGTSNILIDFRSKWGLALGSKSHYETEKGVTDFLVYGLHNRQYKADDFIGKFNIPKERFRTLLKHSAKIGKRTYLNTHIDYVSDIRVFNDFFFDDTHQFAYSYAHIGLKYWGDNFNFSFVIQPRVNDFNTTLERLPEASININRYNLFDNLYYSQKTTASLLKLKWLNSDIPRGDGANDFEDYQSGRFDSLHFFHYYGHLGNINFTPRIGFRAVRYSTSSVASVNAEQLSHLIDEDDPYIDRGELINNYDEDGEAITRLIPEFGLEINFNLESQTNRQGKKLSKELIHHSIMPYINWNYVPEVDENRDNIFFFDDVDRITGNHFIRLGLNQNMRTTYKSKSRRIFNINQYVDYHLGDESEEDFWGDYGIILSLAFTKKLSLSNEVLTDVNEKKTRSILTGIQYETDEVKGSLSYIKRENYLSRDRYSGGSFLDNAVDSTYYSRLYNKLNSVRLNFEKKLTNEWAVDYLTLYDLDRKILIHSSLKLSYSADCLVYEFRLVDTGEEKRFFFDFSLRNLPHSILQDILK